VDEDVSLDSNNQHYDAPRFELLLHSFTKPLTAAGLLDKRDLLVQCVKQTDIDKSPVSVVVLCALRG
jgi:hypothetical protein